ncbi:hypothetical protein SSS_09687 [Sarcoptes scabiei]|nr:hypothetical protein SSS_09687 [Sarcoptes scabiei]
MFVSLLSLSLFVYLIRNYLQVLLRAEREEISKSLHYSNELNPSKLIDSILINLILIILNLIISFKRSNEKMIQMDIIYSALHLIQFIIDSKNFPLIYCNRKSITVLNYLSVLFTLLSTLSMIVFEQFHYDFGQASNQIKYRSPPI